jgi:hypothetical protein
MFKRNENLFLNAEFLSPQFVKKNIYQKRSPIALLYLCCGNFEILTALVPPFIFGYSSRLFCEAKEHFPHEFCIG